MSIIIWLLKAQWGYTVDHLTYEKGWCIDRTSNLLIGVINIALILFSLLHHFHWLIPLVVFNLIVLFSVLTGKGLLHRFLAYAGFQERDFILHQIKIESQARERIKNMYLKK